VPKVRSARQVSHFDGRHRQMRLRRQRSSRRSESPPGRKVWGGWQTFDIGNVVSTIELQPNEFIHTWMLSPNDASDFYDEPTVIRMLFRFIAHGDITGADSGNEWMALVHASIQVFQFDDVNLPFIENRDGTKDYLWQLSTLLWHAEDRAFGSPSIALGAELNNGTLDIRSKRKIPEGHGLSFFCYNDPTVRDDALGISFYTSGRVLFIDH